jgi:hypothetical protein
VNLTIILETQELDAIHVMEKNKMHSTSSFLLVAFGSSFPRTNSHVEGLVVERLEGEEEKMKYFNTLSYSLHGPRLFFALQALFYPKFFVVPIHF